ncbi:hypothetical protein QBC36DRAFT_390617 [Triangularia setosa]|uniref:Uncharacterized protein n=1 Tax=Triangularia setosa TaxID=2587417 RepID=A0AAN6VZM7_9PEZI|nr:hypothetical protein QBC36DRAFT_390617 [Podospora setosa]
MKQGLTLLSAFAWLQIASAACCRSNKCFKAIANPLVNGQQDCSSLIETLTVTAYVTTITETATETPTVYATLVETDISTETVSSTIATETLLNTVSTAVTAATTTQRSVVRVTRAYDTVTVFVTSTTTILASAETGIAERAADTELATSSGIPTSYIPSYASAHCPSWDKYVSACECAGVTQETLTASPSTATVTVTFTESAVPITISVPTTISTTATIVELITATETGTRTNIASLTATVSTTVTQNVLVIGLTTTVTSTIIQTTVVTPVETCKSNVGNFQAVATQYANTERYVFAQLNNGMAGLYGASGVNPDSYRDGYLATIAWVNPGTTGTMPLQVRTGAEVKGCVNSVTGGKKNILICGTSVYLSTGDGSETGLTCTRMYPKIIPV